MNSRTVKSFAWLWIGSLLIATVGVSGQQIYCYCVGKTTLSLFAAAESCGETQKSQRKECCAIPPIRHSANSCDKGKQSGREKKGCTKRTTRFFQLKTEFTLQEKDTAPNESVCLDQDICLPDLPYFPPRPDGANIVFQTFAHPPPLSGRMMCVRYGVFLC